MVSGIWLSSMPKSYAEVQKNWTKSVFWTQPECCTHEPLAALVTAQDQCKIELVNGPTRSGKGVRRWRMDVEGVRGRSVGKFVTKMHCMHIWNSQRVNKHITFKKAISFPWNCQLCHAARLQVIVSYSKSFLPNSLLETVFPLNPGQYCILGGKRHKRQQVLSWEPQYVTQEQGSLEGTEAFLSVGFPSIAYGMRTNASCICKHAN